MKTTIRGLSVLGLTLLLSGLLAAEERPVAKKAPARVAVAKLATETGTLLRREAPDKPWQMVKQGEKLYTGDLLIGLPWAAIETNNGAFRVTFRAEFARKSPFPILEAAIVLRPHEGVDLDFFLDRGRVDVTALKDKPATFTFGWQGKEPCLFKVNQKGTNVMLETYARWAPGVPFDPKGGPEHRPVADIVFLVTHGEVMACTRDADVLLKAPPGLAVFTANSEGFSDKAPRFVQKLPEWLTENEAGPEAQKAKARLTEFRNLAAEKGMAGVISAFLASDDFAKQRTAIIALAATDNIDGLRTVFMTTKSPEILDLCILVMRNWLGRDPSHDKIFYDRLLAMPQATPALAGTVLQLLHNFGERELAQPETYEALVSYLRHKLLAIRALAYYHLIRLYPEGKTFGFNPAGTEEERAAAVAKWRAALEAGKLLPKQGS